MRPPHSAGPRKRRPRGTGSESRHWARWCRCPRCDRRLARSGQLQCPARSLRLQGSTGQRTAPRPRPAHAPPTPLEAGASRPSPSASDWLSCLWARPQTICGRHRGPAHSLVAQPLTPPLQRLSPRISSSLPALGFLRAGLSRSVYKTQLP